MNSLTFLSPICVLFPNQSLKTGTWQHQFSRFHLFQVQSYRTEAWIWVCTGRASQKRPWTHTGVSRRNAPLCAEPVTPGSLSVIPAQLLEFGVSFYSLIALKCFKTIHIWKWLILCVFKDIFSMSFCILEWTEKIKVFWKQSGKITLYRTLKRKHLGFHFKSKEL